MQSKLVNQTTLEFPSEVHMDGFIRMMEERGEELFDMMSAVGCVRMNVSRVWNRQDKFIIAQLFEYRDEKAFLDGQKVMNDFIATHRQESDKFMMKATATRGVVLVDYSVD